MFKIKSLLAIGTIFLFFGLAISPATASTNETIEFGSIGNGFFSNRLELKESELIELNELLERFTNQARGAGSLLELLSIIRKFIRDGGRHPFFVLLLQTVIKMISLSNMINKLRPVRKKAIIMSWGVTNKFVSLKDNQAKLLRPFTTWYYSGRSKLLINSRTLIIDPYPFSIKSLTGRQIGVMRNFAGIYIHSNGAFTQKSWTFFMGYVSCVRGLDLSPFESWK